MSRHVFAYCASSSTPSWSMSTHMKRCLLSSSLQHPLDRINVLGSDHYGHTGCVNALSWARDGELLISGGDDTTVRVWCMDTADSSHDYPFKCGTVIHTGHRGNIFNAQMLPYSTRIATVAADRQVRISDVGAAVHPAGYSGETEYTGRQANVKVLHCHSGRVKRIVTEESPDMFLTVAEDGSVRQHDLRVPHRCASGNCPAPLVRMNHELNTIALSPLTPYQFVVAGDSPYGYLFDRRHTGRMLKEEWGMLPDSSDLTTCVRRFGRPTRGPGESRGYEHITGARMASTNGHEVLLSYSSDAVYLYSTHDDPADSSNANSPIVGMPSPERSPHGLSTSFENDSEVMHRTDTEMDEDIERIRVEESTLRDEYGYLIDYMEEAEVGGDDDGEEDEEGSEVKFDGIPMVSTSTVPIVYPRARFAGACNIETVKDVNFFGPQNEFITSGSDDGNFFIWRKSTGQLHGIFEGDGSIVNVVEGHPHLPLIAVSGIDTTVKLFGPSRGPSEFSRSQNAENIMKRNSEVRSRRVDLTNLFLRVHLARQARGEGDSGSECHVQ